MPGADPVAVIGMGTTGTLLARALAAAGHPILACGRTPLAAITVNEVYAVIWSTAVSAERIRAGCHAATIAASSPARMRRMACRWTVRQAAITSAAASSGSAVPVAVSVDAYRDADNAADYRDALRAYRRFGKPVAVTEFGCCTYRGAAGRGGLGWMITDENSDPPLIPGTYERDEQEQVRHLHDMLAVYETEDIDSAFWFTFAGFEQPRHPTDPHRDLDLASYGIVAVLEHERGTTYPDMA